MTSAALCVERPPPAAETTHGLTRALPALDTLAALIEGLPEPVWLVDGAELRVLAANAAAGRLLGVPAAELRGRSMAEMSSTPQDLCFWTEVA
ncbi:MAG TPA: PAS domain-containing protein, partial [Burkholderiaceae bacterium]|nr:PAS domain-containing protein [Burkholderiaceae bacterium]